uniref:Transmembrane protein 208 n=1 Tax=Steinernema glaseri TaxID=37863 RepID=A0A1I7ZMB4_9BILA
MNSTASKGKQATRGQKLIDTENRETILYYSAASLITSGLFAILNLVIFTATTYEWLGWFLAALTQAIALFAMQSMRKDVRNQKNQVIDAGIDLNDPGTIGESCKDAIIVSAFVQTVACFWTKIFFALTIIPAYGFYKLWTNILGPWFFAEAPAEEVDEKKQRKKERIKYKRF